MTTRALPLALLLAFALTAPWALGCEGQRDRGPERSERSESAKAAVDEYGLCVDHGVPHDICTKCNPALTPIFKEAGDWCPEHGFPESVCPICHPEVAQGRRDGASKAAGSSPGGVAPAAAEDEELPTVGSIEGRVVRLASPDLEVEAGLGFADVAEVEVAPGVGCTARIEFDADRVADVHAMVPGVVRRVEVSVGARVERGDTMFVLESLDVASVQGRLRSARERARAAETDLTRKRELRATQITSARKLELAERELAQAKAEVKAAETTLRLAGASRRGSSGRYEVTAPIAGQVLRRPATVGALATEATSLATIVDASSVWAICELPDREAHLVGVGDALDLDLGGDERARGEVTWISPEVDPRTRTVRARAVVDNGSGRLRSNQFLHARARTGPPEGALVVPRAAIQRVEGREVVFVRVRAGVYLPRVVVRHGEGDPVAVTGKLERGEEVVTDGAVLLRTEVMPGSIGAGCCEVPGVTEGD